MLGHLPPEVLQEDAMGEMAAKFWEQGERCSHLEDSGSRICDLILGLAGD
jgi:hypothetical protein